MALRLDSVTVQRLAGESMREVGVLVLVFGPLDAILKSDGAASPFATVTALMRLLFTIVGIIIESNALNHSP